MHGTPALPTQMLRCVIVLMALFATMACERSDRLQNAPEPPAPVRTHGTSFVLTPRNNGRLDLVVPFTFTNRTGVRIYLAQCNPPGPSGNGREVEPRMVLEKEIAGEWVLAWQPERQGCLNRPKILQPNEAFSDTVLIYGYPHYGNVSPRFRVDTIPGTYRLVWNAWYYAIEYPDLDPADTVPLRFTVSNRFTVVDAPGSY